MRVEGYVKGRDVCHIFRFKVLRGPNNFPITEIVHILSIILKE